MEGTKIMAKANLVEVIGEVEAVVEAVAPPHLKNCPAERVEQYQATRPSGQPVLVVRCQDCGAEVVSAVVLVIADEGDEVAE